MTTCTIQLTHEALERRTTRAVMELYFHSHKKPPLCLAVLLRRQLRASHADASRERLIRIIAAAEGWPASHAGAK